MAHEQFPAFKLVTLIARQLSSPIATRIKSYAKTHPVFSRTVCARAAETYRRMEWGARLAALRAARAGRGGGGEWWARSPPAPLSHNEARDMGADIIGEIIIFMLGAAIVTFEFNRQAMNKEKAEEEERAAWAALLLMLEQTRRQLEQQQKVIDRLRAVLLAAQQAPQPPHPSPTPAPGSGETGVNGAPTAAFQLSEQCPTL